MKAKALYFQSPRPWELSTACYLVPFLNQSTICEEGAKGILSRLNGNLEAYKRKRLTQEVLSQGFLLAYHFIFSLTRPVYFERGLLVLVSDDLKASHIRTKNLRNSDRTIFILIIFKDGCNGSSDSKTRTI